MKILALALTGVLTLVACGGSDTEPEAMAELRSQVGEVREAAVSGDYDAALRRLNTLRSEALDMSRQNEISEGQFQQILAAALEVEAKLMPSVSDDAGAGTASEDPERDSEGQLEDGESPRPANGSAGGSIRTGDGADGSDGAPGQPGEDGEDGADGVSGITG
ncbi:MAG: hypothetical protein WD602_02465 [Actinomycetota bacterium]